MVKRKEYLHRLIQWKDEQLIKVVTGIRRCGKSTMLMQYQEWLKDNNISDKQIISINFEDLEYEELQDYQKLYDYLKHRLCKGKMTYIFLDEIQKVPSFEKVVDSLYIKADVDIYITGSNAYMLSGDLATLLTGRYVEIKMLPLSFKEFLEICKMDQERGLTEYMRVGGLPYIATMDRTQEKLETYLDLRYLLQYSNCKRYRRSASEERKESGEKENLRYLSTKNHRKISVRCYRKSDICPEHY